MHHLTTLHPSGLLVANGLATNERHWRAAEIAEMESTRGEAFLYPKFQTAGHGSLRMQGVQALP